MKGNVEQRGRAETSRNSVEVKRRGLALGFDAVGIATLEPSAHAAELDQWLAAGYAGTMTYLHRQAKQRKDPATRPKPSCNRTTREAANCGLRLDEGSESVCITA